MHGDPRRGRFRLHSAPLALAVAGLLLLAGSPIAAATTQEERQGSRILSEFEGGTLTCGVASTEDFERVGEYVMGRMLGSGNSHAAMDELMLRMMGAENEPRVHEAMGRRFTGCGGAQLPRGFGRMMGAVAAMGTMGGGMMGGLGSDGGHGSPGAMMGGDSNGVRVDDDGFDGPSAGAMTGMMAALIVAAAAAVLFLARREPNSPLDTLKRRFASGELSAEEYEERKRLLEGG